MSDARFGKVLEGPRDRDAIHVPVVAFKCGEPLGRGVEVGVRNGKVWVASSSNLKPVGVVDPFLKKMSQEDDWVWVMIEPGTIRRVRHAWEHPAFPVGAEGLSEGETALQKLKELKEYVKEQEDGFCCAEYEDMEALWNKIKEA